MEKGQLAADLPVDELVEVLKDMPCDFSDGDVALTELEEVDSEPLQ
jgi:hypothetical protein